MEIEEVIRYVLVSYKIIKRYEEIQISNEFKENEHPRDKDGKFTSAGKTDDRLNEVLGEEYKGYKGQEAIDKLMKEKRGHVKGAFTRKDIGDIDLIWGNENMGLCHIIKRRKEENSNMDIDKFLSNLTEVIEQGRFLKINDKARFEFGYNKKIVVIEPKDVNGKTTFLLTAFKRSKI